MRAATDETFEPFFAANQARALRLAYLMTGDRSRAEDVTAEAFAKMFVRWGEDIRDPRAYLSRIVVNTANSTHRRSRTERGALPLLQVVEDHSDRIGDPAADRDEVMQALAKLPPRQRAVLVLRYYEDRSEAEIAAILGTSTGTVKSNASRGMARLRELLEAPTAPTAPATSTRVPVAA